MRRAAALAALLLAGCVSTAPVPEVRRIACPEHPPAPPCAIPTRDSADPIAAAFAAIACYRDYLATYRENWEACAE